MKLTLEGIKDRKVWEEAGISLPSYDVEAVAEATREKPVWVHFGAGNIFRIFIGGIADVLISEGVSGKGITCRRILTMGRKMPYRPWLSCAAFYTKDIKPEKRLWQWYPWTIAPTTEKSFRNPLPPWQRNGTGESMWRTGLSHICPIASRYPFRGP